MEPSMLAPLSNSPWIFTHNKRAPGPGERQQSLTRLYTGVISKGLKVLTPGTSFPNA